MLASHLLVRDAPAEFANGVMDYDLRQSGGLKKWSSRSLIMCAEFPIAALNRAGYEAGGSRTVDGSAKLMYVGRHKDDTVLL